ncbi:hypothetical protein [Jeotgalibacillus proteolyticus]|uniref:Uncharacterized protein n=1 Tax=Jeotgalibacillus proteolyticus TaxID=2082395 RepID=A0A2S5GDH3_9BACL|nr:hypothetical protein [Jeotgalibacillus proteolyticus]PPA71039.1 hypothetical protein C4B60_09695 [Jeotgalibacillus proteolyticus]
MSTERKKKGLLLPMILAVLNIVFSIFLISAYANGAVLDGLLLSLLIPVLGIISFLVINQREGKNNSSLGRILQGLNVFFVLLPIILRVVGRFFS